MDEPTVSVILPTYNAEENVSRSINSILNQTYGNIELLVVDDDSDDTTKQIVRSYDDERVHLIVRGDAPNGITESLNDGIERASGEFIARQDADDWSEPERFERQIEFMRENDADVVGTSCYNIDSGERVSRRIVPAEPNPRAFNSGTQFVHGSLLFRASALDAVGGYDPSYPTAEDVELLVRLVNSGFTFYNVTEPLYNFEVDPDSKYASSIRETTVCGIHARQQIEEYDPSEFMKLSDEELADVLDTDTMTLLYRELATEYLRFNERANSRTYAIKASPSILSVGVFMLSFAPNPIIELCIKLYRLANAYKMF